MHRYKKKKIRVFIEKIIEKKNISTLEGSVLASPGDYLVHGSAGEVWPISKSSLEEKYKAIENTVFGRTGFYESLPTLVYAYQTGEEKILNLPEFNSLLKAEKGDWILSNTQGKQWVVRSDIFENTYELIEENLK